MGDRLEARDLAVWTHRVLWFLLPVAVGPALVQSWETTGFRVALWVLWAVGLIAAAVLLPHSLTTVRVLAPLPLAGAIWATATDGVQTGDIIALVVSLAVVAVAFSPLLGDRHVDGASYGNERRMLLRPPTRIGLLVVPVTWALAAAGLLVGPLLLVDQRWIAGAIATVVGFPIAAAGVRALHQLVRRWIVFVPNGFVLHDLNALTEPVLFRRTAVERLGPAIAGTPARDLSLGASGLILECELTDAAPLGLRRSDQGATNSELTDVRRFLFVPSRPGALLDEAERRKIAVAGS